LGTESPTAGKLFVIAGILWFVEIPMGFFYSDAIVSLIGGVFGVFFLGGAAFAYRGTMVPIYEKDHAGNPTGRQIGEYEAACYCGLLGLLAMVIAFVSASMVGGVGIDTLPIIVPGLLGGLFAFSAGIVYMRAARKGWKSKTTTYSYY
jgi:hypothetical protein